MIGVMVPNVFAFTTMPDDGKPDGHIPVLDDKIVIVDHNGLSYLQDSLDWYSSDSIIYGDIVNVSDDKLYYLIIRANVYDDGKLLDDTGYMQPYVFRYNFPAEDRDTIALAETPFKFAMHPGESAQFALWPGQVGWDCYEVWVESYELENRFKGITDEFFRNDLEIKSVKDDRGVLKGKIYNPTEHIFDDTMVVVAKYDENGNLFSMKGDYTSSLGPGSTKNFEIPLYLDNYPVKSHMDNFIFGKPANYEVSGIGWSLWMPGVLVQNQLKLSGESKFFPNKNVVSGIDMENIIKTKSERITSSCLNDPDQEFITTSFKQTLPNWIKDNTGHWANGEIDEKEFLTALDYLLKNEILRIDLPQVWLKMELDSYTYYVSKYNSDVLNISGWLVGYEQYDILCDLSRPNSVQNSIMGTTYTDDLTITRNQYDGSFEQNIPLNLDYEEGTYSLKCKQAYDVFPALSFEIIHGESPQDDKIIKPKVPSWIKINAGWWMDDTIDESTFLMGLEYLVQNGIIDAGRYNSALLIN